MTNVVLTPAAPAEPAISPLAAAIAASPAFAAWSLAHTQPGDHAAGAHPLLDALFAFLASPTGQALEQALIAAILGLITRA